MDDKDGVWRGPPRPPGTRFTRTVGTPDTKTGGYSILRQMAFVVVGEARMVTVQADHYGNKVEDWRVVETVRCVQE